MALSDIKANLQTPPIVKFVAHMWGKKGNSKSHTSTSHAAMPV